MQNQAIKKYFLIRLRFACSIKINEVISWIKIILLAFIFQRGEFLIILTLFYLSASDL